jgi:hypothetical protein
MPSARLRSRSAHCNWSSAGVVPSDQLVSDIYGRIMQFATLILIVLASLKLGCSIPWEKILSSLLNKLW